MFQTYKNTLLDALLNFLSFSLIHGFYPQLFGLHCFTAISITTDVTTAMMMRTTSTAITTPAMECITSILRRMQEFIKKFKIQMDFFIPKLLSICDEVKIIIKRHCNTIKIAVVLNKIPKQNNGGHKWNSYNDLYDYGSHNLSSNNVRNN